MSLGKSIHFTINSIRKLTVHFHRLQEINAQPQSVVKGLFRDDPWSQKFKDLLKNRGYVSIKTEQMQGLLLLLFAKREHLLHVRQVESEYTRTGLGGIWVSTDISTYGRPVFICFMFRVTKERLAFVLRYMDVRCVWSIRILLPTIIC